MYNYATESRECFLSKMDSDVHILLEGSPGDTVYMWYDITPGGLTSYTRLRYLKLCCRVFELIQALTILLSISAQPMVPGSPGVLGLPAQLLVEMERVSVPGSALHLGGVG